MGDMRRKILPLYILVFIYLIINIFVKFTPINSIYISVLNPLFLLLIAVLSHFLTVGFRNRTRNKYSKGQNVFIVIFAYVLIYYLSGLIFGFLKNDYSLSPMGILSNFISFFSIAILKEYIRYELLLINKKKYNVILVTLLFILIDIDFYYMSKIGNSINFFRYFLEIIVPVIILNITLTYLAKYVNMTANLTYRGVITAVRLFSPILPNHEWIVTDFFYLIMLMFLVTSIDYLTLLDDRRTRRHERHNEKSSWIFCVVAILFILFVMGVFKYQPIAIMSNSMYDYFARGDVVVIEKIGKNDMAELKRGDVIYYRHDDTYITHRIIAIENDFDSYKFYTKGDNNDLSDEWEVTTDDIVGIIRFKIKYLGWPSVWLYEFIK